MKKLKTKVLAIVNQDGGCHQGPVQIYLDTNDPVEFVIATPSFISDALGGGTSVRATSLEGVLNRYAGRIQAYIKWRRELVSTRVLIVKAGYRAFDGVKVADRNAFFLSSLPSPCVTFSFERALKVGSDYHRPLRDWEVGERFSPNRDYVILNYDPAVEERLQQVQDTLTRAIYALDGLLGAKDVAQALLSNTTLMLK